MSLLGRLQKISAASGALREAVLRKEAGFGTALAGIGKSIANKAVSHVGNQISKNGLLSTALGTGFGAMTAAAIPGAVKNTYKANKAGFNPALHRAEMAQQEKQ